jgi:hypothetical protein
MSTSRRPVSATSSAAFVSCTNGRVDRRAMSHPTIAAAAVTSTPITSSCWRRSASTRWVSL